MKSETRYSIRSCISSGSTEYDTIQEAETEARRLQEFCDVELVKISVVAVYKKKVAR